MLTTMLGRFIHNTPVVWLPKQDMSKEDTSRYTNMVEMIWTYP